MIDKNHKSPADDIGFMLFACEPHACCIEIVKSGTCMCKIYAFLHAITPIIAKRNSK
jgi:hypothetical protein